VLRRRWLSASQKYRHLTEKLSTFKNSKSKSNKRKKANKKYSSKKQKHPTKRTETINKRFLLFFENSLRRK